MISTLRENIKIRLKFISIDLKNPYLIEMKISDQ